MGEKLSMSTATAPPGALSSVELTHTPVAPSTAQVPLVPVDGIGTIDDARQEMLDALADAKTFYSLEPDEVIRMCMGHSARLSEIRVVILRVEVYRREWKPVLKEVETVLDHLREQFAMASRLISIRDLDWRMDTGVKGAAT
jgi:hypothetical protein